MAVADILMHYEVHFLRLCGLETSSVILRDSTLTVFENGVPREIFLSQKEYVTRNWREIRNWEPYGLQSSANIIRVMKAGKLQ